MSISRRRFVVGLGMFGLVVLFVLALLLARFAIAPGDGVVPRGDESREIPCQMDAKLCPDGTAVGRSGPRCEFAPCPPDGGGRPIDSFESCVTAGNPVMESSPRRCTADGVTYAEDLGGREAQGDLHVSVPQPNDLVASPLTVRGEARGNWYFEASFPVRLLDAEGHVLATAKAEAMTDWMTTGLVPFQAILVFLPPKTGTGLLTLEKDNPSDLPEQAAAVRMPVRFVDQPAGRPVRLYFYVPEKDRDENGNLLCSYQGLVPVERIIPFTGTPIQDTIRLLLLGEVTADERARGITTEYPLLGFTLSSALLENGMLTLTFSDERMQTSGGACRAGILRSQIEATARQFKEVKEVKFWPEELFQP